LITKDKLFNLSSIFFEQENPIYLTLEEIKNIANDLSFIAEKYNIAAIEKQTYTAVNLLSSYWIKQEITVIYPMTFGSSVKIFYLTTTPNNVLELVARQYLNTNLPTTNY
jgi:hypothetical protein